MAPRTPTNGPSLSQKPIPRKFVHPITIRCRLLSSSPPYRTTNLASSIPSSPSILDRNFCLYLLCAYAPPALAAAPGNCKNAGRGGFCGQYIILSAPWRSCGGDWEIFEIEQGRNKQNMDQRIMR
jgi:hypothetical protein